MWSSLRSIGWHHVVVSLVTTAMISGALWAGWFVIRETRGDDVAALYAIIVPGVLVLVVIVATVVVNRRQASSVARVVDGTVTVVESDAPLGEAARLAAPWFGEHGFEFAGSWCTALDGVPIEDLSGSAHHTRVVDRVVAHVGDGFVSFTTGLSDGRELVTINRVTFEEPGRIIQRVESGDLDMVDRVHSEGLSILAAAGVVAVEFAAVEVGQLRADRATQSLFRSLGPAQAARLTRRNRSRRIGTLADGGALHTSFDPSQGDRGPVDG